jgi:hypothetical protein
MLCAVNSPTTKVDYQKLLLHLAGCRESVQADLFHSHCLPTQALYDATSRKDRHANE